MKLFKQATRSSSHIVEAFYTKKTTFTEVYAYDFFQFVKEPTKGKIDSKDWFRFYVCCN